MRHRRPGVTTASVALADVPGPDRRRRAGARADPVGCRRRPTPRRCSSSSKRWRRRCHPRRRHRHRCGCAPSAGPCASATPTARAQRWAPPPRRRPHGPDGHAHGCPGLGLRSLQPRLDRRPVVASRRRRRRLLLRHAPVEVRIGDRACRAGHGDRLRRPVGRCVDPAPAPRDPSGRHHVAGHQPDAHRGEGLQQHAAQRTPSNARDRRSGRLRGDSARSKMRSASSATGMPP